MEAAVPRKMPLAVSVPIYRTGELGLLDIARAMILGALKNARHESDTTVPDKAL